MFFNANTSILHYDSIADFRRALDDEGGFRLVTIETLYDLLNDCYYLLNGFMITNCYVYCGDRDKLDELYILLSLIGDDFKDARGRERVLILVDCIKLLGGV